MKPNIFATGRIFSLSGLLAVLTFHFGLWVSNATAQQIQRCATLEIMQQEMRQDPTLEKKRADYEQQIQQWIENNPAQKTNAVITIPVVVHVVYNTTAQNISDAQVRSQIDALNEDFSRTNADKANTPAAFQTAAANTGIQFCLATRTPAGNATTGIIHKYTTAASFTPQLLCPVKYTAKGGDDAWDVTKYLNIWVCNIAGGVLGFAILPLSVPSNDYGAVVNYMAFGRIGNLWSYADLGRTATQEVAHCYNLSHTWGGSGTSCSDTDYCGDTPNQAGTVRDCPAFPFVDACSPSYPGVMFMNYMDYTDDYCKNLFTKDQAARMNAVLNTYPYNALTTSNGCQAPLSAESVTDASNVQLFPNPSNGTLFVDVNAMNMGQVNIKVYNIPGEVVYKLSDKVSASKKFKIEFLDQPNGLYFIEIITPNEKTIQKFILNR